MALPLAYLFADTDDLAEVIMAFSKLSKTERAKALEELKRRTDG